MDIEYRCSPYTVSTGFTELMILVMQTGQKPELLEEIKELLKNDPTMINKQNTKGWTALMLACRNSRTDSSEDTVQLLVDEGAHLNMQEYEGGNTALTMACRYSNTESTENTVQILVNAGADLNIQQESGYTALILACCYCDNDSTKNTVRILIEAGAEINILNVMKKSALYFAILYHIDDLFVAALLERTRIETYIKTRKEINYENTLKHIPEHNNKMRFNKNNLGYKVVELGFRLECQTHIDIYKNLDHKIVDYLSITDPYDMVNKINQYLRG